jgi:G:T/U-mismatch repair DNA glycosylase
MPPAKRTPPSVAPAHVAFTGIKQFLEVFACKGLSTAQLRKRISSANPINTVLPPELFPPGWPFPHDTTKVWVLTSTSGRASAYSARTRAQYAELAKQVALVPWPRNDPSADWSASS